MTDIISETETDQIDTELDDEIDGLEDIDLSALDSSFSDIEDSFTAEQKAEIEDTVKALRGFADQINPILNNVHVLLAEYLSVCSLTGTQPLFTTRYDLLKNTNFTYKDLCTYTYFSDKPNKPVTPRKDFSGKDLLNRNAASQEEIMSKKGHALLLFIEHCETMAAHCNELKRALADKGTPYEVSASVIKIVKATDALLGKYIAREKQRTMLNIPAAAYSGAGDSVTPDDMRRVIEMRFNGKADDESRRYSALVDNLERYRSTKKLAG